VSNFLKRESFEKRLCSSQDICNAIVKQQAISNNNNQRINSQIKNKSNTALSEIFRPVQSTYAYVIPTRNTSRMTQAYRYIQNLTNYYNIFVDEGDYLKTHIMSDGVDYKVLEFHDKIETKVDQQINNKQTKADILVPLQANSKHLAKKMFDWRILQRKNKSRITDSQVESDNQTNSFNIVNEFCKNNRKNCADCIQNCRFRLSELNNECHIKSDQIKNELKLHGHPTNRKMRGSLRKNQTLKESIKELYSHYLKFHYNK